MQTKKPTRTIKNRTRVLMALLVTLAAIWLALIPASPSFADSGDIQVIEAHALSEFPEGIRFTINANSSAGIEHVQVRFSVVGRRVSQYDYIDLPKPRELAINGELFFRTNTPDRYIPPGTIVEYFFEIEDESGSVLQTEPKRLLLLDARFEWESVQSGPVTVYYHGPVERRAENMAEATDITLNNMGPILGAEISTPINITMYNNYAEMIAAVVPRSTTISRELITEGQAFAPENALLVLGSGRRAIGTVSHEVTHILVGRATGGAAVSVPAWLNEGLAEYGNLEPGISYKRFLEWAIDTDRLLPLEQLEQFPGDPNLVIVSYGQSRDVVRYLVEKYGPNKLAEVFAETNNGIPIDRAIQRIYGFSVRELDVQWRETVEASPLPAEKQVALPTPGPTIAALLPYSLPPVPGENAIDIPSPPATRATQVPPATNSPGCSAPATSAAFDLSGLLFIAVICLTWTRRRLFRIVKIRLN